MTEADPIRVVGYIRVSTEEQAGFGVSLEAQAEKIDLYARMHGLELVRVFEDAGISAKSLDRPALQEALGLVRSGEVAGLIITKLDRLTRRVYDLGAILKNFYPEGPGQLLSVGDHIDTRSASGRMLINVIVSIAQWELETIVERTRDGIHHKRSRGERLGQLPFGYDVAADGKTLVPNATQLAAIGIIKSLDSADFTLRAIASELDKLRIPTKNGGEKWAFSTVRKILKDAS